MFNKILKFFGLYPWMSHLKEVNELEDAVVKNRRKIKELEEDLEQLPYQMDKLANIYTENQLDAMFHKISNKVRDKHPRLIDKWLARLEAAKTGKKDKKVKVN